MALNFVHGLLHLFTWTGLEGILDQYGMGFYEGFVVGRLGRFLHGGRRYFSGGFGPGGWQGFGGGMSWLELGVRGWIRSVRGGGSGDAFGRLGVEWFNFFIVYGHVKGQFTPREHMVHIRVSVWYMYRVWLPST